MPCWTIQTNTIDFQQVDFKIFIDALKAEGYNIVSAFDDRKMATFYAKGRGIRMTYNNGKIDASGSSLAGLPTAINELKQTYSRQVVKAQAKRFGWQVREVSPNKYQVFRRA